ncbi:MAG: fasciclin domain-containing protein [candidate division Zixibacteria bacterium]|nr:fasciclin domain-containing protein [candidate division Zixibacteria bacterium]NIR63098.1 fasciclin domain-containing protein [candidate division Zixibacteria bacterium]NIS16574.1 fasciclin domain-containing protein [candidate division Zixibacteria bacterium]NIS45095.1 fasciclin domain-containing protein [candidate division Zixibacteria bacterium]NIT52650.1 fasciclin domain-containing protein [candidate division Zixibacteria bacterium]
MKKTVLTSMLFAFIFAISFGFSNTALADNCATKSTSKTEKSKDIVETAMAADGFNTLVTALKAADLVEALKGEGPFTVFAPTDEAFAKLPEGTIPALLKDKEKLTSILTYHVVSGKVMAADVVKLKSAETLNGQSVAVKVDGKKVMVDNAEVIMTDIVTSNGVIHVINEVILPREEVKRSEY